MDRRAYEGSAVLFFQVDDGIQLHDYFITVDERLTIERSAWTRIIEKEHNKMSCDAKDKYIIGERPLKDQLARPLRVARARCASYIRVLRARADSTVNETHLHTGL